MNMSFPPLPLVLTAHRLPLANTSSEIQVRLERGKPFLIWNYMFTDLLRELQVQPHTQLTIHTGDKLLEIMVYREADHHCAYYTVELDHGTHQLVRFTISEDSPLRLHAEPTFHIEHYTT